MDVAQFSRPRKMLHTSLTYTSPLTCLGFAQSVELLPVSLKEISINYVDWIDPPNLSANDELSAALCKLSRCDRCANLTAFSVSGSVGLSIIDSSDLPLAQNLSSFRVSFECITPNIASTFFGRMSKRGAGVARRLPRGALVKLEYDGCYLIYDKGKLYYCKDHRNELEWDVEDWEHTASYHKHELILRLNKSPSDDGETNYSNDDPEDEHGLFFNYFLLVTSSRLT